MQEQAASPPLVFVLRRQRRTDATRAVSVMIVARVAATVAAMAAAPVIWAAQPATAAPIGTAVDVAQNATADGSGKKRQMSVGSDVSARETIATDEAGSAALRFIDDTRLALGPNSTVRLDSFVFSDENGPSTFVLRATKGAFRFATGRGDHDSYRIQTPTATIGVRGTQFDVIIDGGGTRVAVTEGEVVLCPVRGRPNFVDCAEAVAGQTVMADRTQARAMPTQSLAPPRVVLPALPDATQAARGVRGALPGELPGAVPGRRPGALPGVEDAVRTGRAAVGNPGTALPDSDALPVPTAGSANGVLGGGNGAAAAAAGGGVGVPAGFGGGLGGAAGGLGGAAGGLGGAAGGLGGAAGGLGGALGGVGRR